MLITEDGSQYKEKVIFDSSRNTIVHDVPAHRNLPISYVMIDFDLVRIPRNAILTYNIIYTSSSISAIIYVRVVAGVLT